MIRFLAFFLGLCLIIAHSAMPVHADEATQTKPVLVELFASQNCSACPKAHKTMKDVRASRDDAFILTWSVDYWDYLGAPDPMALPQAKARQAAYVDNLGLRAPYTPQSVYNGIKECPGPRKRQVNKNIDVLTRPIANNDPVLSLRSDGSLDISASQSIAYDIVRIEYLRDDAHKTDMVNPVTSIETIATWPETTQLPALNCTRSCVIVLQVKGSGEVAAFATHTPS